MPLATTSYPEGVVRPIESITTAEWRAHGYDLRAELAAKDDHRNNLTARQRRRRQHVRCPTCTHRSLAVALFHLDAYRCRWDHTTARRDLPR